MALSPALRKAVNAAQNRNSRSTASTIKPKEGKNVYRFLAPMQAPWIGAAGEFWLEMAVHWIKTEPNGKPIAVVGCEDAVHQQPCAICTALDLAYGSAIDEETKKFYKEMMAKKSVLFNVIDRSTSGEDVEILELSPTTAAKIWELMGMYDDAGQDICDLQNGLDIVVSRSGKGLNTEYSVAAKPGVSAPVSSPDIYNRCHDLKAYVEREFFKGDEQKALNAIAQVSGVAIPRLAATRTPTAALTSANTTVADAVPQAQPQVQAPVVQQPVTQPVVEQPVPVVTQPAPTPAPEPVQVTTPAATLSVEEMDDVLAELDNL